jgi:hypothetical protein
VVIIILIDGTRLQFPEGVAAVRRGEHGKGIVVFDATGKAIYANYLPVIAGYLNDKKVEHIG